MTADEARKLTLEHSGSAILKEILKDIEHQCQRGSNCLKVRGYGFGDGEMYSKSMPNWTQTQKDVFSNLAKLGYQVKHVADERQFVDLYLEIQW